ncbi:MAG: OB-fold nucleic acid binding domain-containing protein, partial [Vicinamibacterales bacterium]
RTAHLARWRARLFASIDGACEHGSRTQRDKELGQTDLFGGGGEGGGGAAVPLPDVAAWTEIELLTYEKETLGLYFTGHPMDRWAGDLREYGAKSIADLGLKKEPEADDIGDTGAPPANGNGMAPAGAQGGKAARVAEEISIGGIVSGLRALKTRKGDRMSVFMLEDRDGSLEVVVFPEAFKQYGHLAENGNTVVVKGKFERDDESARIVASEIMPIERVRETLATSVAIRLSTPPHDRRTFEKLWDLFAQHKGDRRVVFDVELKETDRRLRMKVDVNGTIRVRPSERLVAEVEKICGTGSVSLR